MVFQSKVNLIRVIGRLDDDANNSRERFVIGNYIAHCCKSLNSLQLFHLKEVFSQESAAFGFSHSIVTLFNNAKQFFEEIYVFVYFLIFCQITCLYS